MDAFDFVKDAYRGKYSPSKYNSFMVNRIMSSNSSIFEVADILNDTSFLRVPDEIKSKICFDFIKNSGNQYSKYYKTYKEPSDSEDSNLICKRLECSPKEASDYLKNNYISKTKMKQLKKEGFIE